MVEQFSGGKGRDVSLARGLAGAGAMRQRVGLTLKTDQITLLLLLLLTSIVLCDHTLSKHLNLESKTEL